MKGAARPSVLRVVACTLCAYVALRVLANPFQQSEAARGAWIPGDWQIRYSRVGIDRQALICASVVVAAAWVAWVARGDREGGRRRAGVLVALAGALLVPAWSALHSEAPALGLIVIAAGHCVLAYVLIVTGHRWGYLLGVTVMAASFFLGLARVATGSPLLAARYAGGWALPLVLGTWLSGARWGDSRQSVSLDRVGAVLRDLRARLLVAAAAGLGLTFLWLYGWNVTLRLRPALPSALCMSAGAVWLAPLVVVLAQLRAASRRARAVGVAVACAAGVGSGFVGYALYMSHFAQQGVGAGEPMFEVVAQTLARLMERPQEGTWLLHGALAPGAWLLLRYARLPLGSRVLVLLAWLSWGVFEPRWVLHARLGSGPAMTLASSGVPLWLILLGVEVWERRVAGKALEWGRT